MGECEKWKPSYPHNKEKIHNAIAEKQSLVKNQMPFQNNTNLNDAPTPTISKQKWNK